ncbi:hypothetical protein HanPSC8_Chr08g0339101 [Helianthus annuus]|nr:hypothetical protein HanPSC8_Chr08g0339101 [Helianthus annuus]
MQILVPKCNLHKFHRIQSTTPFISSSFLAYFRSTPTSSKNKCFDKPTFIRYKTRQKRADAKKALNDIYFGSGSSKFTLEGEYLKKRWKKSWDDDPTEHKNRRDPSARRWWDGDRTEHKNRRDPYARRWDDDPTENRNRRESKAHQKRKKNKWKRANTLLKNLMILRSISRQHLEIDGIFGLLSRGKSLFHKVKNLDASIQIPEINGGL